MTIGRTGRTTGTTPFRLIQLAHELSCWKKLGREKTNDSPKSLIRGSSRFNSHSVLQPNGVIPGIQTFIVPLSDTSDRSGQPGGLFRSQLSTKGAVTVILSIMTLPKLQQVLPKSKVANPFGSVPTPQSDWKLPPTFTTRHRQKSVLHIWIRDTYSPDTNPCVFLITLSFRKKRKKNWKNVINAQGSAKKKSHDFGILRCPSSLDTGKTSGINANNSFILLMFRMMRELA